jgi:hypothetical protein
MDLVPTKGIPFQNKNNKGETAMKDQYKKDVGALFKNTRRKHERAPLLLGSIELSIGLVNHLFALVDTGSPAKLNLAAWKNRSKDGLAYYTLTAQGESPDEDSRPTARHPVFEDDLDL